MAKVKIVSYDIRKVDKNKYRITVVVRVSPQVIAGQQEVDISGTLRVIFVSQGLGAVSKTIAVTDFGNYTVVLTANETRGPGRYDSRIIAELNAYTMVLKGMGVVATRSRDVVKFLMVVALPRVVPPPPPEKRRSYRVPTPPRRLATRGGAGVRPVRRPLMF